MLSSRLSAQFVSCCQNYCILKQEKSDTFCYFESLSYGYSIIIISNILLYNILFYKQQTLKLCINNVDSVIYLFICSEGVKKWTADISLCYL